MSFNVLLSVSELLSGYGHSACLSKYSIESQAVLLDFFDSVYQLHMARIRPMIKNETSMYPL